MSLSQFFGLAAAAALVLWILPTIIFVIVHWDERRRWK